MYSLSEYALSLIASNPEHCRVQCRGLLLDLRTATQADLARLYLITAGKTALVEKKAPPSPRRKPKSTK